MVPSRRSTLPSGFIPGPMATPSTAAPVFPAAPDPVVAADPWALVPAILARLDEPRFSEEDFLVTHHGAAGDGRTDDQAALQRAIDLCAAGGGGRVVVPPGDFLTGPLRLRSGVNLHLRAGAVLRFVTDSCRFSGPVLTRWEGVECLGLMPAVYACDESRVAVTGAGVLDGQAGPGRWWDWAGPWDGDRATGWAPGVADQRAARARLLQWGGAGVPVAERVLTTTDRLRPMFLQFYRCRDVLVEGVTIRNTPMWAVHPALCRGVTVRRVQVVSHGPNNDGCVVDSCRDVLVEDCVFETGDDCIAVKSGRDRDGWRVGAPAEDVVIRGCRMRAGHSAVALGSEVSGGIRRVFIERCVLEGPALDHVLRIKANSARGGAVGEVCLREVAAARAREAAVRVDLGYEAAGERGDRPPTVGELAIDRLECRESGRAVWIDGLPEMPVRAVQVRDSVFGRVAAPNVLRHVEGFAAVRTEFPVPSR
jgi:polygalacturonase